MKKPANYKPVHKVCRICGRIKTVKHFLAEWIDKPGAICELCRGEDMRKFRPDQCPLCKNHNAHEPWVKNEEVNSYGHCLPPKYYGFAGRLPDYFCGEAKRKCQDFEAKT